MKTTHIAFNNELNGQKFWVEMALENVYQLKAHGELIMVIDTANKCCWAKEIYFVDRGSDLGSKLGRELAKAAQK